MAIGSITGTFNTPSAEQVASRADTLDRLDFLQMLMAQMRNQDPMSPMDSQEYAAQLAQFSSVQELTAIKAALDESINMNMLMTQSINGNLAAALVGKTVRAQNNAISLTGTEGADLRYTLSGAATDVQIEIRNEAGDVVRTIAANAQPEGAAAVFWDGRDQNGNQAPNGRYTFTVAAKNADGNDVTATTYTQGVVTAINYANGAVTLTVNGNEVLLGDIMAVMATEDGGSDEFTDAFMGPR